MKTTTLKNEFAMVEVMIDEHANGPRLLIRDLQTGTSIYLDPLELEALTRIRHEHLGVFLDPSFEDESSEAWIDEVMKVSK